MESRMSATGSSTFIIPLSKSIMVVLLMLMLLSLCGWQLVSAFNTSTCSSSRRRRNFVVPHLRRNAIVPESDKVVIGRSSRRQNRIFDSHLLFGVRATSSEEEENQESSSLADEAYSSLGPYCVNLMCTLKEERREEFIKLIQSNQRLTLSEEPDSLQYTVGVDLDDANTFYLHEEFLSEQAFLDHRDTSHNAAWQTFKATNPFVEGTPVTSFFYANGGGAKTKVPIPSKGVYCLNVELNIDASRREEFLDVIKENARGSNKDEPLCLQYVWGEDLSEKNKFHFHEAYLEGEKGFKAHQSSPHFAQWETFASSEPFTKPPIIQFFTTV